MPEFLEYIVGIIHTKFQLSISSSFSGKNSNFILRYRRFSEKGSKNRKIAIFWHFSSSKWLKLIFHSQQHQIQVSTKFQAFSCSTFHFMALKPSKNGHFWPRKRLKFTHENCNISKTTWNFDKRSKLVNLYNSTRQNKTNKWKKCWTPPCTLKFMCN